MDIQKKNLIEINILKESSVSIEDMTMLLKSYVKSWILNKDEIKCLKVMGKNKEFMDKNSREYSMLYNNNLINIPQLIHNTEDKVKISPIDAIHIFNKENAVI